MKEMPISLHDIAGYATERTVWRLVLDMASHCGHGSLDGIAAKDIRVDGERFVCAGRASSHAKGSKSFSAPETFSNQSSTASDVWAIGALAFYAITGVNVFEGKGGISQTSSTMIPRIASSHAGRALSSLIYQSLSFDPAARPLPEAIEQLAKEHLLKPSKVGKRLTNHVGQRYKISLVKFWPEEMALILMMVILSSFPSFAQTDFDIPAEMSGLVAKCHELRVPSNSERVYKALDRDMCWTMMDELPVDKESECTTSDLVDEFGLNSLGFRILKYRGGVTNAGGRFRDGRDPRYKYSFIEVTVKKGHAARYEISGREGPQLFAIIPFNKDAIFKADISGGESFIKDGTFYIRIDRNIKPSDKFTLSLHNESSENLAFAIINYNSRSHE